MKAFVNDTIKVDQTSKDLFTRGFVVREDLTKYHTRRGLLVKTI